MRCAWLAGTASSLLDLYNFGVASALVSGIKDQTPDPQVFALFCCRIHQHNALDSSECFIDVSGRSVGRKIGIPVACILIRKIEIVFHRRAKEKGALLRLGPAVHASQMLQEFFRARSDDGH